MEADAESVPADEAQGVEASTDRITRATSVAAVAGALVVWWPAFTLAAYGVVFFQQALSLWVASTAIFLVSLTAGRREPPRNAPAHSRVIELLPRMPLTTIRRGMLRRWRWWRRCSTTPATSATAQPSA